MLAGIKVIPCWWKGPHELMLLQFIFFIKELTSPWRHQSAQPCKLVPQFSRTYTQIHTYTHTYTYTCIGAHVLYGIFPGKIESISYMQLHKIFENFFTKDLSFIVVHFHCILFHATAKLLLTKLTIKTNTDDDDGDDDDDDDTTTTTVTMITIIHKKTLIDRPGYRIAWQISQQSKQLSFQWRHMSAMASHITGNSNVCSTTCSG